ncbi:Apolipoprotein N-acyltransferase / Copper homeostasis protein CutE [invertebrate metagenome]|uniref:Apolipoprotein N-acyltransferase / Copper homeostasis protein CutE n=1 Tax=invertebrate metagenome TaxID=1711999 RepID=A0A484H5K5_9ZZZZ
MNSHIYIDLVALRVRSLSGWRRSVLAITLGSGLAAVAMPPAGIWPVLLVTFSGLVWLLDDAAKSNQHAFVTGWWFGAGFFSTSSYWIACAFLVNPESFAWMIPFALATLTAGLALFTGLAAWLTVTISRPGPQRGIALAGTWTMSEMMRGALGFPWNPIAHAWTNVDSMLQSAAVFGVYGTSLMTVLMTAVPATLVGSKAMTGRQRIGVIVAVIGLWTLLFGAGTTRLNIIDRDSQFSKVENVKLRLVQPNTNQSLRWVPELRTKHFLQQIAMSLGPGFEKITHVIWPETASAFSLDWHAEARQLVAKAVPPGGAVLTGVMRTTPPIMTSARFWNSLMAINHKGSIVALYDKAHLVPFGEYIPIIGLLSLPKMTVGSTDFSPGLGIQTMTVPGIPPLSPLICYEVIFPGAVVERTGHTRWMLNITNDAWFGMSAGPYQHFASARWRAVEEGLPLVRVAVTGISGVIDPYGRIVEVIDLGIMGARDVSLPMALQKAPLFAQWGNTIATALIVICFGTSLMLRGHRRRS